MATQSINQVKPLFALGQMVATPGDLDEEDKATNDNALKDGRRVLSAYRFEKVTLWVITEADRSATTILLPEEY